MKHISVKNIEHAWDIIRDRYLCEIYLDEEGTRKAGYDIYETCDRTARISDMGDRVEITYYDGSEPVMYECESETINEVFFVPENAKSEHEIFSDFAHRYPADVFDLKGVFTSYEEACQYLEIILARNPSEANWGSVYLTTEGGKYTLINTLRKYGVKFNVSGCGSGYHISILTQGQTDIDLVNLILSNIHE